MKHKVYLAVDLGASSGRVMAGIWNGNEIELEEVHRFGSPAVFLPPYHHWDILSIYREVVQGLRLAKQEYGDRVISLGVDTWGVDYGLLDSAGELLANPIQYRDERTLDLLHSEQKRIGREKIYAETGIQFMFFNTLYQLAAERAANRAAFSQAKSLLFLPDLFNYWLTGKKIQERTIASTSQLLNPHTGKWSEALLAELGLADSPLFGEITEPGNCLGSLAPHLREELGEALQVVTVCGHDTASAVAATPFASENSAFLSSGTWSIMGRELSEPNTTPEALAAAFSNEIGYGQTVRFLKNIGGMWLVEESRRHWAKQGEEYSYNAIVELARSAPPRRSLIDPDHPELGTPGNMPDRIASLCERSGQPRPGNPGEILRVAFDSLAMKYRFVFQQLEKLGKSKIDRLHIVGGGAHNDFLNQMAADAIGVPIEAGPTEATSLGNIIIQMIATGALPDLATARRHIAQSFPTKSFTPLATAEWAAEDERFRALLA
jgi:sugar (pentulose or hexulose) kinase